MRTRSERGFAMILAILAIALLGTGLIAALLLFSSERRVVDAQRGQMEAFAVAESGLEQFLANRVALGFTASPAAAYESTRVTVTGGYADVVLQRLRPAVGTAPATYVVRSRGVTVAPVQSGLTRAERVVARLAHWQPGGINTTAALTGLGGIAKTGSSGTLTGVDNCGAAASLSGVAVPTVPGYTQTTGGSVPAGSPPITYLGATTALAAAAVRVDWAGITAGTSLTPDVRIPAQAWPSFSNSSYWPVILVTGAFTLPGNGRGTLIVTGNLTISAGRTWDGVILAGGAMIVTGNVQANGAAMAGLNAKLGQIVPATTISSGNKRFRYDSCSIASALGRFGGLSGLPNAWLDNWPSY